MKKRPKLTDEQRKQLAPILEQLERGFDELSRKLAEMSLPPDEEPFAQCLAQLPGGRSCACEAFVPPGHGQPWRCARPGCGHSFTRHDVW
jgi:hypothetical protein